MDAPCSLRVPAGAGLLAAARGATTLTIGDLTEEKQPTNAPLAQARFIRTASITAVSIWLIPNQLSPRRRLAAGE